MKTNITLLNLIAVFSAFLFIACNESSNKLDYRYATTVTNLDCGEEHNELIKEAVGSFEEDLRQAYAPERGNPLMTYGRYVSSAMRVNGNVKDLATSHSLEVMDALRDVEGLWIVEGNNVSLNDNHPIVQCLVDNVKNDQLRTTMKSLQSIDNLDHILLQSRLRMVVGTMPQDKSLVAYVALDSYYPRLYHVKESELMGKTKVQEPSEPQLPRPINEQADENDHNH